jgi:MIP family channel proteins
VHSLGSKLLCEFVGTFFLIAVGVAVILNGGDLLAVAFAHGLVIAIMVSAVGHVSGAHFNPAVTTTMLALKQMPLVEGVAYLVTQLVAGALGAFVVAKGFDIDTDKLAGATPTLADGIGTGQGLLLEVVATFALVWVIFAVAVDRDGAFFKVAGMPIGFAVTTGILLCGPETGAALNPARWFGPALVSGSWDDAWVWIVGPILGGALAGAAYLYGVKPRLAGPAAAPDTV